MSSRRDLMDQGRGVNDGILAGCGLPRAATGQL